MAEGVVQLAGTRLTAEPVGGEVTVILCRDEGTPDFFTMLQLQTVFGLSDELAEHIILIARSAGNARVLTRPRDEAEDLINKAQAAAQLFGFPHVFILEHGVCKLETNPRRAANPYAVRCILLIAALLLALAVAFADRAGDVAYPDVTRWLEMGTAHELPVGDFLRVQANVSCMAAGAISIHLIQTLTWNG